jgi:hypothetical protein
MNAPRETTCTAVRAELAACLYGEADAAREAELHAHLDQCDACRAEWEVLVEAKHLLGAWTTLATGGDDPREVATDVVRRARRRATWRPLLLGAAAAAIGFVLLGALGGRAEVEGGRFTLSFALPFVEPAPARGSQPTDWTESVRNIARAELDEQASAWRELQELQLYDLRLREEQERLKLVHAIDRVREHDRDGLVAILDAVQQGASQENRITREALFELASRVTFEQEN